MTTQKRDVLLTLMSVAVGTNQAQLDGFWFEVEGPVNKAAINRGLRLYAKDKQEKGRIINRNEIFVYNVFVAENE